MGLTNIQLFQKLAEEFDRDTKRNDDDQQTDIKTLVVLGDVSIEVSCLLLDASLARGSVVLLQIINKVLSREHRRQLLSPLAGRLTRQSPGLCWKSRERYYGTD